MSVVKGQSLQAREAMGAGKLSSAYTDALDYAARQHRDQMRIGSRVPYLSHLMSVSSLVLEHGGSETAAIAGLLHDAVEDAPEGQGPHVLTEIDERFGAEVAALVRACSDGLDEEGHRSGTWEDRKQAYLQALRHKTPNALLVTAADKTHNAGCIADDVGTYGPDFWGVFNACRHRLAWYYASVLDSIEEAMPGSTITASLREAVTRLVAAAGCEFPPPGADMPSCDCPVKESAH